MMGDDPRVELSELVRAARAWVEWVHHSGADFVPAEAPPAEVLRWLDAPLPQQARQRGGPPPGRGRVGAPSRPAQGAENRQGQAQRGPQQPQRGGHPQGGHDRREPQREPGSGGAPREAARSEGGRPASLSSEERQRRLALIDERVRTCTQCRLHETRTQTVFARGSSDAELVFVGEGPGAEEDRQGLPFVGAAGQLLDKMIVAMGYRPEMVYITNVVKCRPPKNRKPEPDEIEACTPYLREQLEIIAPQAMVALGATGIQGLLGTRAGITRLRGTWKLYRGRIPLMPTFHPAYLLRSPDKKRDVWNDLKQVMERLGKKPPTKS